MFQTKVVQNIELHAYVHYFFPEYRAVLRDYVESYGRIEQATDDII